MVQPLVALEKWAIGFVTEEQLGGKPAACEYCTLLYVKQGRCSIIGPDIKIGGVEQDGVTYRPVCSQQDPGKPVECEDEDVVYRSSLLGAAKADEVGLEWARGKGTNCGGKRDGAMCEAHYLPISNVRGRCRPLQAEVGPGDCCAAHNGPAMPWRDAQLLIKEEAHE